jgi:hypothetical protein
MRDLAGLRGAIYFVSCWDGPDIRAMAFAHRHGSVLRIPVYAATDSGKAQGATESVIQKGVEIADFLDLAAVDLGSSTDPATGLDIPGIVLFKQELGATASAIYTADLRLA